MKSIKEKPSVARYFWQFYCNVRPKFNQARFTGLSGRTDSQAALNTYNNFKSL